MAKLLSFRAIFVLALLFCLIDGLKEGSLAKPPMGWTSKAVGCDVNQSLVNKMAGKLITSGMAVRGYQYVKISDCWQGGRNQVSKNISQNLIKFPKGIKDLAESLKLKGLKLGLGSDIGTTTCSNQSGSYGYEQQDSLTISNWQQPFSYHRIDHVEYTNCNNLTNPKLRYYLMSKYLSQTEKPIFYSIDNHANDRTWEWASTISNSWTTVQKSPSNWSDLIAVLQKQVGLENYASPGHWNYPGELLVENGKLTKNQLTAHFALWCLLKAPLFVSADLTQLSAETYQILTNQELIAINQDEKGVQAKRVKSQIGSQFKREVWSGPLSNGSQVIAFLNRGETDTTISVSLKNDLCLNVGYYAERDPIRHASSAISNQDILSFKLAPHSIEVRIISGLKQPHLTFQ